MAWAVVSVTSLQCLAGNVRSTAMPVVTPKVYADVANAGTRVKAMGDVCVAAASTPSSEATSCAVQRVGRRRAVLGRRADYVGEGTHSYDVVVITGCADCRKLWGSQTRPS